ncbi:MAG: hypothetical protein PWP15_1236 [Methanothermococcus sp.]|nr:hypothetical protein [Methanothermococcus sp.]
MAYKKIIFKKVVLNKGRILKMWHLIKKKFKMGSVQFN